MKRKPFLLLPSPAKALVDNFTIVTSIRNQATTLRDEFDLLSQPFNAEANYG